MTSGDDGEGGSEPSPTAAEAVGYGKPPAAHRFKKGKSGNPAGRPKKQRTPAPTIAMEIADLLKAEARRLITVRENNQEIKMPVITAAFRAQSLAALKGNARAQAGIIKIMAAAEAEERELYLRHFKGAIGYKDRYKDIFEDHDKRGKKRPDVLPHPNEITIDMNNCDVIYNGPMDEMQRARWDGLLSKRDECLETVELFEGVMRDGLMAQDQCEGSIRYYRMLAATIDCHIPSKDVRRTPGFNIHKWRKAQAASPEFTAILADYARDKETKQRAKQIAKVLKIHLP